MDEKVYSATEISLWPYQATDLIATYEELYNIPFEQQVTEYVGDFGQHFFKSFDEEITPERISGLFHRALRAVDMSADEFFAQKNSFVFRQNIINLMSNKMNEPLADKISAARAETEHRENKSTVLNKSLNCEER